MYCGECHGLGWPGEVQCPLFVPEVGSADAPYPPFDDALAKFVADGRLAFSIYGPRNADEAERLMFPDGLKLSVPQVARSLRTIGAVAAFALRRLHWQSAEERLK